MPEGVARPGSDPVRDGRVVMIGPIRQELLSGVRTGAEHTRPRSQLRAFAEEPLVTADFEAAAEAARGRGAVSGRARSRGALTF